MNQNPFQENGQGQRNIEPCILVIFGATGDLTAKKLMPAIYNLKREGQLPAQFVCVGFARREKTNEQFRDEMKTAISEHSRVKPIDEGLWQTFKEQIFYHRSDFDKDEGYIALKDALAKLDKQFGTKGNRVFYLSTQPSYFPEIVQKLHKNGHIYDYEKEQEKWSRIIIEKPFGHDLDSAKALQAELTKYLSEEQIYRIDHYLGKETVQNLLVFRFGNALFENLWNNRYIDHIQITVAEDIGIGTRGNFYEESGLLRDIVQNHMMQLLSLVAMEPPVNLSSNAVRDEKVKVLQAIAPFNDTTFESHAVRGQYGKGVIVGKEVKGYREEDKVNPNSQMETYVALKLFVNNWRWDGVPFYLRGAKRLPKRATEIAVTFKTPPGHLFQFNDKRNSNNVLAIRIQPNEGSSLKINCKVPGPANVIQPVKMDFRYGAFFGLAPPEAYERLICDCMAKDNTLFAREDEAFNSWRIMTPLLDYWKETKPKDFPNYQSGSWGPEEADKMIEADGRHWRLI
ncbi:MAG: glucose-6-phosphate dehydrogenase [Simkaniaceae bacterium]|nr:glucose-6-phosphate dehydrogenase [Simkaniaceae bacterium]